MKRWILISAMAVIVLGAAPMSRAATAAPDGCVVLEETILRLVRRGADDGALDPLLRLHAGRTLVCRYSAEAITAAFSQAMAQQNIYVSWQTPEEQRGDLCLSGNVAQCYPRGNPAVPLSHDDAAYLAESWYAVLRAVGDAMPQGFRGDVVRFSPAGLAAGLAQELGRSRVGRLPPEHTRQ
jgi:hypothetical protein